MKTISVMQPWAWLIVNGHKDIENRTWRTSYRGPILIHAGKKLDRDAAWYLGRGLHPVTGAPIGIALPRDYEMGGIVGAADLHDCLDDSASPWFVGKFGFVMRSARPLPFRPCRGSLGIFNLEL